jgi:hypothetical protein
VRHVHAACRRPTQPAPSTPAAYPPHVTAVDAIAPEDVEHAVGRRREAHSDARGGARAGSEGVDLLEAEVAQKQDDDKQPAGSLHHNVIQYNNRASEIAHGFAGGPAFCDTKRYTYIHTYIHTYIVCVYVCMCVCVLCVSARARACAIFPKAAVKGTTQYTAIPAPLQQLAGILMHEYTMRQSVRP